MSEGIGIVAAASFLSRHGPGYLIGAAFVLLLVFVVWLIDREMDKKKNHDFEDDLY
jgi:hypothetical protein